MCQAAVLKLLRLLGLLDVYIYIYIMWRSYEAPNLRLSLVIDYQGYHMSEYHVRLSGLSGLSGLLGLSGRLGLLGLLGRLGLLGSPPV